MAHHPATIDHRKHPEHYRIGRGEQGVLTIEPYKSEILPHWRFRTFREARKSAAEILRLFACYRKEHDFVGMDMARKFIQMGYTRSRRYARHRSGRKYARDGTELPLAPDPEKDLSAQVFRGALERIRGDSLYRKLKREYLRRHARRRKRG